MSKFSDRLGASKPKKEDSRKWEEVNIGVDCPKCAYFPDHVWYDRSSKKLKIECGLGHEEIIEMDLSWLMQ